MTMMTRSFLESKPNFGNQIYVHSVYNVKHMRHTPRWCSLLIIFKGVALDLIGHIKAVHQLSRIRVKFPLREELTWWIDFSARLISLNGWNLIQGQKHTVFHLDSSSIAQIDLKSSLKPNLSNGILDVDFVHIIREVNYDKILFKIFRETSNT